MLIVIPLCNYYRCSFLLMRISLGGQGAGPTAWATPERIVHFEDRAYFVQSLKGLGGWRDVLIVIVIIYMF